MNPSLFQPRRRNTVLPTDIATQAFIDKVASYSYTALPTNQQTALNNWIIATKANGNMWANATHIFRRSFGTTTGINSTRINIKNPDGLLATVVGGVTLTNNGYYYNGTTGYANNRWMPFDDGFTVNNVGLLHCIMADFPNSVGSFGINQSGPTRRLGISPRRTTSGGNPTSNMFASDYETALVTTPAANRIIATGRLVGDKYSQINNYREISAIEAKIPLPNIDYYSGAMNNNGNANNFCNGTERLVILGGAMTKAEVDQQFIINNNYYGELGLPLNS